MDRNVLRAADFFVELTEKCRRKGAEREGFWPKFYRESLFLACHKIAGRGAFRKKDKRFLGEK